MLHDAQVWNAVSGEQLLTYARHKRSISALAWSPEGFSLASGGRDKVVNIWDARSGKTIQAYLGHTEGVLAVSCITKSEH